MYLLSCRYRKYTKLLSTFNPSRLAPVEHTHTHGDRCHTLERWAADHSPQGSMGAPRSWQGTINATPPAVSPPIFEWWEWESNHQPSGCWTTHSNPWPVFQPKDGLLHLHQHHFVPMNHKLIRIQPLRLDPLEPFISLICCEIKQKSLFWPSSYDSIFFDNQLNWKSQSLHKSKM